MMVEFPVLYADSYRNIHIN